MAWTDLSAAVAGAPPAPRYGHGFAAAGGLLYSFGGMGQDGDLREKVGDIEGFRVAEAVQLNCDGAFRPTEL